LSFFTIPLKNLIRRPFRTILTILGVSLAVSSFIALIGLARGLEQAWSRSLEDRDTHILAANKHSVELLTGSLDQRLLAQLKAVPDIQAVSGELIDLISLEGGPTVLLAGWPADSYLWQTLRFKKGQACNNLDSGLILGQRLADGFSLSVGDKIPIRDTRLMITGIFEQGSAMIDNMVILPLPIAQQLLGRPGMVTVFNLRLTHPENPKAVAQVKNRLEQLFPNLSFTETSMITRSNRILRLLRAIAWSTSTIALLMGLFIVLNTLLMTITERTRDIGILTAVGWSAQRILAMIVSEGLILSAAGSLSGSILGWGALKWLGKLPQVQGFIEPRVSLQLLTEVFGASLVLGILGSLYPAWRATRLNSVEALRYE
jgi:putative ABC transport system permease protein